MKETEIEQLRQIVSRTDKTGNEKVEMLVEFVNLQVKNLTLPQVSVLLSDDYWKVRCKLSEAIEEQNPCDPDITSEQIAAWSDYYNFIKVHGQRQ